MSNSTLETLLTLCCNESNLHTVSTLGTLLRIMFITVPCSLKENSLETASTLEFLLASQSSLPVWLSTLSSSPPPSPDRRTA